MSRAVEVTGSRLFYESPPLMRPLLCIQKKSPKKLGYMSRFYLQITSCFVIRAPMNQINQSIRFKPTPFHRPWFKRDKYKELA